ncbi:MAG: hypothetical protein ACFFAE_08770, partial [Candidatus Hodarchaeota archaeon]
MKRKGLLFSLICISFCVHQIMISPQAAGRDLQSITHGIVLLKPVKASQSVISIGTSPFFELNVGNDTGFDIFPSHLSGGYAKIFCNSSSEFVTLYYTRRFTHFPFVFENTSIPMTEISSDNWLTTIAIAPSENITYWVGDGKYISEKKWFKVLPDVWNDCYGTGEVEAGQGHGASWAELKSNIDQINGSFLVTFSTHSYASKTGKNGTIEDPFLRINRINLEDVSFVRLHNQNASDYYPDEEGFYTMDVWYPWGGHTYTDAEIAFNTTDPYGEFYKICMSHFAEWKQAFTADGEVRAFFESYKQQYGDNLYDIGIAWDGEYGRPSDSQMERDWGCEDNSKKNDTLAIYKYWHSRIREWRPFYWTILQIPVYWDYSQVNDTWFYMSFDYHNIQPKDWDSGDETNPNEVGWDVYGPWAYIRDLSERPILRFCVNAGNEDLNQEFTAHEAWYISSGDGDSVVEPGEFTAHANISNAKGVGAGTWDQILYIFLFNPHFAPIFTTRAAQWNTPYNKAGYVGYYFDSEEKAFVKRISLLINRIPYLDHLEWQGGYTTSPAGRWWEYGEKPSWLNFNTTWSNNNPNLDDPLAYALMNETGSMQQLIISNRGNTSITTRVTVGNELFDWLGVSELVAFNASNINQPWNYLNREGTNYFDVPLDAYSLSIWKIGVPFEVLGLPQKYDGYPSNSIWQDASIKIIDYDSSTNMINVNLTSSINQFAMFYLPKTATIGTLIVNGEDISNRAFELREDQRYALVIYYPSINPPENQDFTPPFIDSPLDMTIEEGKSGYSIIWTPSDPNPSHYNLLKNSSQIESGQWTGQPILISLDGITAGTYVFTCTVYDTANNSARDMVKVFV